MARSGIRLLRKTDPSHLSVLAPAWALRAKAPTLAQRRLALARSTVNVTRAACESVNLMRVPRRVGPAFAALAPRAGAATRKRLGTSLRSPNVSADAGGPGGLGGAAIVTVAEVASLRPVGSSTVRVPVCGPGVANDFCTTAPSAWVPSSKLQEWVR